MNFVKNEVEVFVSTEIRVKIKVPRVLSVAFYYISVIFRKKKN